MVMEMFTFDNKYAGWCNDINLGQYFVGILFEYQSITN
jgi:hypothetical protein